jgi:hypothetical protein
MCPNHTRYQLIFGQLKMISGRFIIDFIDKDILSARKWPLMNFLSYNMDKITSFCPLSGNIWTWPSLRLLPHHTPGSGNCAVWPRRVRFERSTQASTPMT